jgi:hypothetical protein
MLKYLLCLGISYFTSANSRTPWRRLPSRSILSHIVVLYSVLYAQFEGHSLHRLALIHRLPPQITIRSGLSGSYFKLVFLLKQLRPPLFEYCLTSSALSG